MPKVTTTVTTREEVRIAPKLQRKLLVELQSYGELAMERKGITKSMDGHRAKVLAIADAEVGEKKFEIEGYKVAVVNDAEDRRLDRIKLVKLLISDGHYSSTSAEDLLDRATTRKAKKAYVKITAPGDTDDE
jgi:hypothetical protein